MRRPDLFIVGAAKCGTTALEAYLRRHPEVFMSPLKEPHYFGRDLPFVDRAPFSESEYLSLFAGARGERRIGEKSSCYLYSKQAAAASTASINDTLRTIARSTPNTCLVEPASVLCDSGSCRMVKG